MRAVDEDIRAAALSAGRHIAVAVEIAAKSGGEYITKQTLQSEIEYIKITVGGDSDGVAIGKTYCAKLVLKIPRYIDIAESDRLIVRAGYDTGAETTTGKIPLGWFYVDNIEINGLVATVTAFDKLLRGSKNYISTLDYPAVLPNVLDEVCLQIGLSLDSSVTVPEYMINSPPIRGKDKDGNTLYYSKRQMLGFIGSLMGGNWFINGGGHLDIAKITDPVDTISADNVFESAINSDVFTVTGIAWNTGNQTLKRQDVDARGVIEFFNPLNIIEEPIIAKLEMALVGKSYYGGKIKRQGAGWHEIGDVVTVPIDKNGNTKPILLTGIERVFENGGYTETWQSCAQTESEANYTVDSVDTSDSDGETQNDVYAIKSRRYLNNEINKDWAKAELRAGWYGDESVEYGIVRDETDGELGKICHYNNGNVDIITDFTSVGGNYSTIRMGPSGISTSNLSIGGNLSNGLTISIGNGDTRNKVVMCDNGGKGFFSAYRNGQRMLHITETLSGALSIAFGTDGCSVVFNPDGTITFNHKNGTRTI